MEVLKFKTNVESQEALSKVAPYLDKEDNISKWSIDVESTDKILSVSGVNLDPGIVEKAVEQAGYKADIVRVIGLSGSDL